MTRNEELDRLRALAVVATVYAHIADLWLWKVPFLEMLRQYSGGYDGVLLFFTISGFVISASLLPKFDAARAKGEGTTGVLLAFFCKRLFRITPTATAWILILLAIIYIISPQNIAANLYGARAALLNYFNIYIVILDPPPNMFGLYWSLSLEEQFYLVLPVVIFLFRTASARLCGLAGLVAICELSGLKVGPALPITSIVGGVVLFILDRQHGILEKARNSRLASRRVLIPISALFCIGLFLMPFLRNVAPHYTVFMGVYCTIFVFIAAIGKNTVLPIWGMNKVLSWLGTRSFSLYLAHLPTILVTRCVWMVILPHLGFNYSSENNLLIFLSWLSITIVAVEISYRFFEKPLTDTGRKVAAKIESGEVSLIRKKRNLA